MRLSKIYIMQTSACSAGVPVVDALKGLFAGQEDVSQWQADIDSTLTLGNTLRLKLTHLLWVSWNHHLRGEEGREEEKITMLLQRITEC